MLCLTSKLVYINGYPPFLAYLDYDDAEAADAPDGPSRLRTHMKMN
jgi:hypothetical protein